jgi:flagellar basal body-associated protein FliL
VKKALVLVYRILLGIVIALALIFFSGTMWALFLRQSGVAPASLSRSGGFSVQEERIFTGIGRQRFLCSDGTMVILDVTFPYDSADKAFSEELSSRIPGFRSITAEYFKGQSGSELEETPEDELKAGLLVQYNKILRLGKLEVLYFNDFMLIR